MCVQCVALIDVVWTILGFLASYLVELKLLASYMYLIESMATSQSRCK